MVESELPIEEKDPNSFPIRPYARLLTMLGEQLIKNERIALVELVKNSYDADASWVTISFKDFGDNFEILPSSKIVIEDDGYGMSGETIKKHWLNPATPGKKILKGINDTTPKGRKIQGEKGIGRFAVLKLGKKADIVTRPEGSDVEWTVDFDFTRYDDDFLEESGKEKELFLSDLSVKVTNKTAQIIVEKSLTFLNDTLRPSHGTLIEITGLKGLWNAKKIEDIYRDLSRLQSSFHEGLSYADDEEKPETIEQGHIDTVFNCHIYVNGVEQNYRESYKDSLEQLLKNSTVLKIENGEFDPVKSEFTFTLNSVPYELPLTDPALKGVTLFRNYMNKDKTPEQIKEEKTKGIQEPFVTDCGPFKFGFYIFDFNAKLPSKYALSREEKDVIKSHRIYLYRDGIRVYPYGDQEDDWLRIDALRGTVSAGDFLSNDQVVGFVKITQKENSELKDKTNREGLIDTGKPHDDFIILIQTLLSYIRAVPYEKYLITQKNIKVVSIYKEEKVKSDLAAAKLAVADNPAATALIETAEKNYQAERSYLVQRAETTEDLAGVGLSVETASHDIQSIMGKALMFIDAMVKKAQNKTYDLNQLFTELSSLRGMLSFIDAQLRDIQLLFRSSKQRRRDIRVADIVDKVVKIYQSLLDRDQIQLIIIPHGAPLVAKTTDAVLLQVLLNLFDNSIYWLDSVAIKPKKIEIRLDGDSGTLFFSDNGPGIRPEDTDFIFEPFFSGKGQAGRGLGLYIARQLLERHEYSIDLADLKANQYLSGANFVISFTKE